MEREEIKSEPIKKYITKEMLAEEKIIKTENKIDAEEGNLYIPMFCITVIAINVLVFIMEIANGALLSSENIINFGAIYKPLIMNGEYWRIITGIFLHGGVYHLVSNMVVFYILAMNFEKFYTVKKVVAIYFISGIAGAIFSISMSNGPSVGASGAIFGVMGATGYYLIKNKEIFNEINKRTGKAVIIVGIIWILQGMGTPLTDNYAHIGGFAGGIISAFILKGRNELEYREYLLKNIKK